MFSSNATAYQPTVCASYPYRYTLHTEKCDFSLGSKRWLLCKLLSQLHTLEEWIFCSATCICDEFNGAKFNSNLIHNTTKRTTLKTNIDCKKTKTKKKSCNVLQWAHKSINEFPMPRSFFGQSLAAGTQAGLHQLKI